jgi:hypothetical protein
MARLFDNNAANYMRRASVNLGLNGSTECSFAAWFKIPAIPASTDCVFWKNTSVASVETILMRVRTAGNIACEISSHLTGSIFPEWITSAGVSLNVWHRALFTWKRNAIDSTDGIIYLDGVSVATTFAANGYIGTFTLGEESAAYDIGIREGTIEPYEGSLAWVTVWNRQLTAQEAVTDAANPLGVLSGRVSQVELCPDSELVFGGSMTVNGTVPCTDGPFGTQIAGGGKRMHSMIYSQG